MDYCKIIDTWGTRARLSAAKHRLDLSLVLAVIMQESSGNERAISSCGARGLTQIMRGALSDYNKAHKLVFQFDQMFLPEINIEVGCWYLSHLIGRWKGDVAKGLQSYNQGFSRVTRSPEAGLWYAEGVLRHEVEFDKLIAATGNDQSVT